MDPAEEYSMSMTLRSAAQVLPPGGPGGAIGK